MIRPTVRSPFTEREFKVVLPKFDNDGHRISNLRHEVYAKKMSEHFGGVTVHPTVVGCVISEKTKKIQCEENVMMIASRDIEPKDRPRAQTIFSDDRAYMQRLARIAGQEFGQQSIMFTEDIIKDVEFLEGRRTPTVPRRIREISPFRRLV